MLDEQFKIVTGSSGFEQVGASGAATIHTKSNLTVAKSGYLYIYTSNEATDIDVFFDNLQSLPRTCFGVTHIRGPILEETHYYPFGLTMAGISSKALDGLAENKYRFNDGTELASKEFSDGSGLELYETPFRGYDPQTGRFWQIDEMASDYESWSPYTFSLNNPILFNDPTGLKPDDTSDPDDPERPVVTKASLLSEVIVKSTPKNKFNYPKWVTFVELNKHHDQAVIQKILINQGVNDQGIKLFNQAWDNIGYRERLAEIEAGWREFVEDGLIEGVTWVAGGPVIKIGGKLFKVGYRSFKLGKPAKGGRVFWSGGDIAKNSAMNFAKENGMKTLEMTTSGRIMNTVSPYLPRSISKPIWDRLSGNFARGATGNIHVFHNAAGVSLNSTWRRIEYDILKNNNIIFHTVK